MAVPNYEACTLPLMHLLQDGAVHSMRELTEQVADRLGLSEDQRAEMLPSGAQSVISNRVAWAKTYLKKAGLLDNPARGKVQITQAGRDLLAQAPPLISRETLLAYPSFQEFVSPAAAADEPTDAHAAVTGSPAVGRTPDEAIETAYTEIRNALADELLDQVGACSPLFFERLVLKLLTAMGYGGAIPDSATHVGRTRDGGIDGIIHEDKLGLDIICVQAKRWTESVGRPLVQAFAGSMEAHRAKKGVMITTSTFSRDARDFVDRIERRIVLIDGQQLAQLMIDYDIGVATARTYAVKRVDSDFFTE